MPTQPDGVLVPHEIWNRVMAAINATPMAPQDRTHFLLGRGSSPEEVAKWLEGHKEALVAFGQKYQGESDELNAYRNVTNGLAFLFAQVHVVWDGDGGVQLKGAEGNKAVKEGLAYLFSEMQKEAEKRGWWGVVKPHD